MRKFARDDETEPVNDKGLLNGQYSNDFTVGHNAFEFLLDFFQTFDDGQALRHTRIITTPVYAKSLLRLLRESVEQYESIFGAIPNGENNK